VHLARLLDAARAEIVLPADVDEVVLPAVLLREVDVPFLVAE